MNKNIQMPMSFLTSVYSLISRLEGVELDSDTKTLCKTLETQIEAKINAMDRRKTFTEYKTAASGSDEREQHRKAYLEKAGMHPEWQSTKEIHN